MFRDYINEKGSRRKSKIKRIKKTISMTGIELIAKERQEQIEKHGYTLEHDAEVNYDGQLVDAAISIVFPTPVGPNAWDDQVWQRMCNKPRRERLIIAGALIAAEIDRLQSS